MPDKSYESYDVFLSWGQDTRRGFTDHLWKALDDKGIHTFLDDSIPEEEAIEQSRIHTFVENLIHKEELRAFEQWRIAIIVLSQNYASSRRCLSELCKILDRMRTEKGTLILPVFYDVDPSDVRLQKGPFGEAFERHEEKFKDDKEKVRKWRDALAEVANFFGWVYRNQPKYQLIQVIVEHVFQNLDRIPLPKIDYVVGIESRIQEVLPLLELESNYDGTLMMGIYGPPGIGKTTLAAEICDRIAEQFEAFCFLDNLRENSRLEHLQNKLLSKMTGEKDSNLTSVDEGALRIKKRFQQKKVLVILDDVDTLEQLEALAGKPDWFGPGSRVIVTTRNMSLLTFHGIIRTYEVQPLNHKDALQLLSNQVFKQGNVDSSYTGILNELVSYASGLPKALEVIGSHLYGKSVEECESALVRFKRIPPDEIQSILKISFDALKGEEKSVFLDIACCFQGYELSTVLEILSAHHNDDYAKLHIDVLIKNSLISVNSDGKVTLLPLIENMGKDIVRQENSKQPGKRSRLWYPEDIIEVLQNNTGTSSIEMIHLDSPLVKDGEAIEWDGEAFKKMNNLKTLIIRKYNKFSKAPVYLPDSLRVLEWPSYPSNKLPSDFNPNQLTICKLPNTVIISPQESFYLSRLGYPQPLLHAQDEPLLHAHDEPLLHAQDEPLLHAHDEPLLHAQDEPLLHAHDEPLLHAQDEPLLHAHDEPLLHAQDEPLLHVHDEPLLHAQDEPLLHAQDEDLPSTSSSLILQTSPVVSDVVTSTSAVVSDVVTSRFTERYFLSSVSQIWILVGLISCVVGLACFALSPSSIRSTGEWTAWKFFIYGAFITGYLIAILFAEGFLRFIRNVWNQIKDFPIFIQAFQSRIPQVLQTLSNFTNASALQNSLRDPRDPPPYPLMDIFSVDNKNNIWRVVGLMSSVVGMSCFALSPSFGRLIRGWNAWKFILYEVFSLIVLIAFLSAKQSTRPVGHAWYKIKGFAILMFIAVYTLYYDKAVNGKPEILSIVSNAAFALMSLCYSKLTKYAHEMGVFSFFLSCLTAQLWIINRMLIFVAICFGFPLFVLHSSSEPRISIHIPV